MTSPREVIRFGKPLRGVRLMQKPTRSADEERAERRDRENYERGRLDGARMQNEALAQEREELRRLQNGLLASLREALPQAVRDCEKSLVDLALEAARRLVADLPISAPLVETVVQEALREVERSGTVEVLVHAEDLELLKHAQSPLLNGPSGQIQFEPSGDVNRGGCIVRTRFGVIDARRETKFDALKEALAA